MPAAPERDQARSESAPRAIQAMKASRLGLPSTQSAAKSPEPFLHARLPAVDSTAICPRQSASPATGRAPRSPRGIRLPGHSETAQSQTPSAAIRTFHLSCQAHSNWRECSTQRIRPGKPAEKPDTCLLQPYSSAGKPHVAARRTPGRLATPIRVIEAMSFTPHPTRC